MVVPVVPVVGPVVGPVVVTAAGVMVVRMRTKQVTTLPPAFPVPLHWFTVTGTAGLTTDSGATVQCTVPPPPVAEPLHWVTVAPVVVAGKGAQFTVPPPPVAEPTHWLTVAAVIGCAAVVPELMLFVYVTVQVMRCPVSLFEPLHWFTLVTIAVELLTKVPFPGAHGPSRQVLVSAVLSRDVRR